jgi:streptogramin lyase
MPATAETVSYRKYTLDADFDEGTLVGVEHETVHDQLQLNKTATTLPFIWVPNSNEGTVSKVDTVTGKELGRYRTCPKSKGNPSRTTVDLQGNCWVGNRKTGTVVKIGLSEAGQYIDKNHDGFVNTSTDINGDGDITGDEVLPWDDDECVLLEVLLGDAKSEPRGLAVDASNNLWAGTSAGRKYYYIDGSTGAILKTLDIAPLNHEPYGAVIDESGILWSSGRGTNTLLSIDPATDTMNILNLDHFVYGLGIDTNNSLFVSGGGDKMLSRVNVTTSSVDWTKTHDSMKKSRGVAVTGDGDVWVANSNRNSVSRYYNNGTFKTEINVGKVPTGVAVDAAGKVWVCDNGDNDIHRIDPATDTIDLSKKIIGGKHYSYSDMTGIIARTITTKIGAWTVDFDSEVADTQWDKVSWNSSEPTGTSVTVKVRSSNDQTSWHSWNTTANGASLSVPDGRYLQIESTLQITSGDVSPVLYDLTVEAVGPINQPPVADAGTDQTAYQNRASGARVRLDGSGSTDDGQIQPLTYSWTLPDGGSATSVDPRVVLPAGTTTVTLTVFDGQFSDDDTVNITVIAVPQTPPTGASVPTLTPLGITALIGTLGILGAVLIMRRR